MPLPRIWKAYRWFAAHPPADALVRAYFGIKDPAPAGNQRPRSYSSEDEVLGIARALGMGT